MKDLKLELNVPGTQEMDVAEMTRQNGGCQIFVKYTPPKNYFHLYQSRKMQEQRLKNNILRKIGCTHTV